MLAVVSALFANALIAVLKLVAALIRPPRQAKLTTPQRSGAVNRALDGAAPKRSR